MDKIKELFGNSYRIADNQKELEFIPTDLEELNKLIFICGGLPRGRVIEIAGKNNTGKSTFMQWCVGQVQKRGGKAAWFDAEKSFLKAYATGSGINLKELVFPEFGLGEDMLYKVKLAIASNEFDLIVIDSQDAIKPSSLQEMKATGQNMQEKLERAKLWAQFYRDVLGGYSIKGASGKNVESNEEVLIFQKGKEVVKKDIHRISQKKCCLAIIAHLTPCPGVIFGKQQDTSGSDANKFLYSLRIWLLSRQGVKGQKDKKNIIKYSKVNLKAEKQKLGIPEECKICSIKMTYDGNIESLSKLDEIETETMGDEIAGEE